IALGRASGGDREIDVDDVCLDGLGDPELRLARVDLSGHSLNLDGVRVEIRLPADELPVLPGQDVDDGRFDLHGHVADTESGAGEEAALRGAGATDGGRAGRLVAQKVGLDDSAGLDAVELGALELEAEPRVACAELHALMVRGVTSPPGDRAVAGRLV